uniref:DNA-directed RNA polymerases I and III subunit RPAC1 n=1 Tax=Anthurium amnicola TaxID=1678845 RepID=A0A1D1ZGR5_9ARAE
MKKVSFMDMPDVPKRQLPAHLELQKTRVLCGSDAPTHTDGIQYSGAYVSMGVDNSLRLDSFCNNFRVEIVQLTEDDIEFDMIGIDASLANAFRRILIAEIPTMAIEKVLMVNNTSVIADEVLAHRLGLIPLNVDPRIFEYFSVNDSPNERNTIVFKLDVSCKKGSPRITVKSDQLKWLPNGSELEMELPNPSAKPKSYTSFSCSQASLPEFSNKPIGPKHEDIIIAKLGPGQAIELEAHAVKGIGKTHAKWSPVATAWYRMLPEVVLLKEIEGELAVELVKKCPVNVFQEIEDIGKGKKKAVVANPRACTLCRECIRGEGWEERVAVRRVKDHFIFKIESTGALPPEVLFTEAIKILEEKCDRVISELS